MGGGGPKEHVVKNNNANTSSFSGSTSGSTSVNIPGFARPMFNTGVDAFKTGIDRLKADAPLQGVAGFTPYESSAHEGLANFASNPAYEAAMGGLMDFATGKYGMGGTGFNAAVDAAQRAALPETISAFGGMAGNPLAAVAMQQATADEFAEQDLARLDRQRSAIDALPGMAMMPLQLQQQVGQDQRLLDQAGLDALFNRDMQNLQNANSLASLPLQLPWASTFGTNTTSTTNNRQKGTSQGQTAQPIYQPEPWQQALGIGATALGGLSSLAGPMGLPGIAAAGGMGGLLKGIF